MTEGNISADVLFEACAAGDLASVESLLQNTAYVTKALETEERVFDEKLQLTRRSLNLSIMFNKAARAGSSDLVKYLLSFGHNHDVSYDKLISRSGILAGIEGADGAAVLAEMHAVKPDVVNVNLGHCGTPLSQAIAGSRNAPKYSSDRTPLARFLLKNGADPNQCHGPDHETPGSNLRTAVQRASIEVLELLLQHGAQVEQSGAMHKAAELGRIDVLDLLLQHGANVNEQLWANLEFSASHRTKVKKEKGIISDVSDDRRPKWSHETPLHYSVVSEQAEATSWLVSHGADASITDSKGWSAKEMATAIKNTSILEALAPSDGKKLG